MRSKIGREVKEIRQQREEDGNESDMEVSSALEPGEDYQELSTASQKSWAQLLVSLLCLFAMIAGLAASFLGIFLLLYSFLSRSYIPARTHLTKDLYFDYTDSSATATADFRESLWGVSKQGTQSFPLGTKLTIWMELEAAEAHGNVNTEMFQVLAQILTSNGQIAASVSRPCLLTAWSPIVQSIRNLISAPAVLLGLWREHQILNVPLFSRYPDQPEKPLQAFRAILKATSANNQLPHLYSAKVHIQLALGFIGRILYWLRPGKWNFLALLGISSSAIVGGLLVSGISLILYLSLGSKSHAPPHSPPHSDTDTEDEDGKVEESSLVGSSSELSELEKKENKEKAFLAGDTLPKVSGSLGGEKSSKGLFNKIKPSAPPVPA